MPVHQIKPTVPGSRSESDFQNHPAGFQVATSGRIVRQAQDFNNEGLFTRSVGEPQYDVQAFTGYATSTNPAGQWNRGSIARYGAPVMRLPREKYVVDPTDPSTWHQAQK